MAESKKLKPIYLIPVKEIEPYCRLLNEHRLSELTIESEKFSLTLKGGLSNRVSSVSGEGLEDSAVGVIGKAGYAVESSAGKPTEKQSGKLTDDHPHKSGHVVFSPMVGTVYLAPQPEARDFIAIGDVVKAGDTLLMIESMKLYNPILAPVSGVIKAINVRNKQPVEFGEELVVIE